MVLIFLIKDGKMIDENYKIEKNGPKIWAIKINLKKHSNSKINENWLKPKVKNLS